MGSTPRYKQSGKKVVVPSVFLTYTNNVDYSWLRSSKQDIMLKEDDNECNYCMSSSTTVITNKNRYGRDHSVVSSPYHHRCSLSLSISVVILAQVSILVANVARFVLSPVMAWPTMDGAPYHELVVVFRCWMQRRRKRYRSGSSAMLQTGRCRATCMGCWA